MKQIMKIAIEVAAPVAERLRALFLNHSIISPLCLVWVRVPHWPHVRQASKSSEHTHVPVRKGMGLTAISST